MGETERYRGGEGGRTSILPLNRQAGRKKETVPTDRCLEKKTTFKRQTEEKRKEEVSEQLMYGSQVNDYITHTDVGEKHAWRSLIPATVPN